MCGNPDLPGQCSCIGSGDTDGFDAPNPALGQDAALGGEALALSEKSLSKAQKRRVTAHQVRALATRKDELDNVVNSTVGVYNAVNRVHNFHAAQAKKKPATEKNEEMGNDSFAGGPLQSSEPLDKDLTSAVANLKSKNQMLNAANQARAPKFGLGDQKPMATKFTKEEWIDIANEGDPAKRLTKYPSDANETAVPASTGDKNAKKLGQGKEIKTVAGANSEKYPVSKEVAKGEVPMPKPPSGVNMGTAVPKAKVAAPKLPAPAMPKPVAPKAPAAPKLPGMGKSEELEKGKLGRFATGALAVGSLLTGAAIKPAADHAKAKVAQHLKAPTQDAPKVAQKSDVWAGEGKPEQHELAAKKPAFGMADLAAGKAKLQAQGVQPQSKLGMGPQVPGLKAPPASMKAAPPKLPGMGAKPAAPVKKPLFGKAEMNDLKCSMCKAAEHPGDCK